MWLKLILAGTKNEIIKKMRVQKKPTVINYSVTNRCNCKCKMCNVWGDKYHSHKELSPKEIGDILSNEFYNSINHIGLSGGEPFIREDIVEIVDSITKNTKNLNSLSFISNGTLEERIISSLPNIINICKERNISFAISFSLDAIGDLHDEIRGHKGAFIKLTKLLDKLDDLKIDYTFSTTIVKQNIDDLFNVLNYSKSRGKKVYFRLASKIDRLYNSELVENFNFSIEEKYKIAKFLEGVMVNYETIPTRKMLYFSLMKKLTSKYKRKSGCLWQNQGISFDPEGNFHYCFVKSPTLGNALTMDSKALYKGNKSILHNIVKNECDECHHDYGGIDSPGLIYDYLMYSMGRIFRYKIFNRFVNASSAILTPVLKHLKPKARFQDNAYITGWYGTETLGDKAILAGIINVLKEINPNTHFTISSYVPYHTEETMLSISTKSYDVIGKKFKEKVKKMKKSQVVIFGGGPLMDIEDVNDVLFEFILAKILRKKTVVFGAGIGPIKDLRLKTIIKRIFQLSDVIVLRDEKGSLKYNELIDGLDYKIIIDPSVVYLRQKLDSQTSDEYVLMCIRDWPEVYCDKDNDYELIKRSFEESLVNIINRLIKNGEKILLFPMHTYHIGDDDRYFFNHIANLVQSDQLMIYNKDYNLNEGIGVFNSAKAVIGMRFHSVVFGNSLEKPTLALDYDTNKGKIFGFVSIIEKEDSYFNIKEIEESKLVDVFYSLIENYKDSNNKTSKILDEKVMELNDYIRNNI